MLYLKAKKEKDDHNMKIAIVEDERIHQDYIVNLLENAAIDLEITLSIKVFDSGEAFLFALEDQKPDAVLLDIQLKSMNGYTLAEIIRKNDKRLPLAFITGEKDYVFDGYKVDACAYLLKPINKAAITQLLAKIKDKVNSSDIPLILKAKDGIVNLYQSDVYYIEGANHSTSIKTKNDTYCSNKRLNDWEEELNKESFFKPHRSFLINLGMIEKIEKAYCTMKDSTQVPIARGQWEPLMKAYLAYRRKDYH